MAIILGALLTVSQVLSVVVLYNALAIALAIVLPWYIPGYDVVNGLNDTQAMLLTLLIWDRFYGPYSRLLKGVAKTLQKAKAKRKAD